MVFAPAPSTVLLVLSALIVIAGFVALAIVEQRIAPPRPRAAPRAGALRSEPPGIVNMLTNDATLTAAGFRATVIDLAARGWLRILPPDEEDELARVRPAATAFQGDSLLPHERLVLQHVLARFTSERPIPARYLAVDIRGAWWHRFGRLVADEAVRRGLLRRRWTWKDLAAPAALAVVGLLVWWWSAASGDDSVAVIDSIGRRVAGVAVLVAAIALAAKVVEHVRRPQLTHTDEGVVATERWLAVRARLVEADMASIPPSSMETGDRRLAYATAMCVAEAASVGVGLILTFGGIWAGRFFADVAHGNALESIYERFPEQTDLIADIATGLTALAWLPILAGLLMAIGGAADGFATVNRTGIVLRARRPVEVSPLPTALRRRLERDRYSLFIAVDDGTDDTIQAWRCSERTAVPQGARATINATPFLGHVRSSAPVGHRLVD